MFCRLCWGNTESRFSCHRFTRVRELHSLVFELQLQRWTTLPQHCYHLSYPKPADEQASVLQAHVALLFDDLLDVLENIPGHCNIPAHVDVSSLLPQALVHPLWQLLTQRILHIFLTRGNDKVKHENEENGRFRRHWGQERFPAFVLKHKVGKCYNSGHLPAVSTFGLPGSLE